MIGFDRPLRPSWIYESLLLARSGQKLSELNKPFESITRELTGKEGKRKARTVLFRCFLRDMENQTRVRNELVLKDLSKDYGLDFMTPIYLFYLVGKTPVLYKISDRLFRIYDFGFSINKSFLGKKLADTYGERDVVIRSVRAFLKTLEYFSVVKHTGRNLALEKKLLVTEEQFRIMLQLLAKEMLGTPQLVLHELPAPIFNYFAFPALKATAQQFNGQYWDYSQGVNGEMITIY